MAAASTYTAPGVGNTILPTYCAKSIFVIPWSLDCTEIAAGDGLAASGYADVVTIPAGCLVLGGYYQVDETDLATGEEPHVSIGTSADAAIFRASAHLEAKGTTKIPFLASTLAEATAAKNYAFTEKTLRITLSSDKPATLAKLSGTIVCMPVTV